MKIIKDILINIETEINIKFNLIGEGFVFYGEGGKIKKGVSDSVFLDDKYILILDESKKECMPLLKFIIKEKYNEEIYDVQRKLVNIIEGEKVFIGKEKDTIKFLQNGFFMALIYLEKDTIMDGVNIIKRLYEKENFLVFIYNNKIVLIGNFDEVEEHVQSIRETIMADLYCKCYISYSNKLIRLEQIQYFYNELNKIMEVGKKVNPKKGTYLIDDMIMEKIAYGLKDEVKYKIYSQYNEVFSNLDNEMISTVEKFIKCGLNISDTSKELYIHRNTLIYRLDKLKKEIGFDLRSFKEASIFLILFLVWKEEK